MNLKKFFTPMLIIALVVVNSAHVFALDEELSLEADPLTAVGYNGITGEITTIAPSER